MRRDTAEIYDFLDDRDVKCHTNTHTKCIATMFDDGGGTTIPTTKDILPASHIIIYFK